MVIFLCRFQIPPHLGNVCVQWSWPKNEQLDRSNEASHALHQRRDKPDLFANLPARRCYQSSDEICRFQYTHDLATYLPLYHERDLQRGVGLRKTRTSPLVSWLSSLVMMMVLLDEQASRQHFKERQMLTSRERVEKARLRKA
jgi:hypothetical protein